MPCPIKRLLFPLLACLISVATPSTCPAFAATPAYERDVAPLLRKYCAGCHNADDAEAGFAADSHAAVIKGSSKGGVIVPGDSGVSRLTRLLRGQLEPRMPPADEAQPTPAEIDLIAEWIDAGAPAPTGMPTRIALQTPALGAAKGVAAPITALLLLPETRILAVARLDTVELRSLDSRELLHTFEGHAGTVNDLACDSDGKLLLVASGQPGLRGELKIWDVASRTEQATLQEHRDSLYAVAISPDGTRIATGGYDRRVLLWDAVSRQVQHTLTQHNGAIYDLAFSPDGRRLASASADETVKVWNVADGTRLDTLGQPEGEQTAVLFSPDGRWIVAGGADNRIRAWEVPGDAPGAQHPLRFTRFAHEGGVVALAWNPAGNVLLSAAEDLSLKVWDTSSFTERALLSRQPDLVTSIVATGPDRFVLGRMDGQWENIQVEGTADEQARVRPRATVPPTTETPMQTFVEVEPNDAPAQPQAFAVPGVVRGTIHSATHPNDTDYYRFSARAGETWILETRAARLKSPLDTRIEVLTESGERIERAVLQAVRDSYFTFRGKDSKQTGDFRLHNWEEMELNQLLYANGEVVMLYRYPRGPDSGFDVYPGFGTRHTRFDTNRVSHALGEPAYIVEPRAPGESLIPNGLPVFPVYFENDDDAEGLLGTDSKLTFQAPADGNYLVRIRDTRGFSGPDFRYELTIRPPRPDYAVQLESRELTVSPGSGKMFQLKATRTDGFQGAIEIRFENVPDGFYVTSPIVIEAGHLTAQGAVYAFPGLQRTPEELQAAWQQLAISARAPELEAHGERVVAPFTAIKLGKSPKLLVRLSPSGAEPAAPGEIPEVTIPAGQTIHVTLSVDRLGNNSVLSFGKEEAGRNLPHGLYVDNIGLNGVLLLPDQHERQVFITADHWVPASSRLIFLRCDQLDNECSWPIRLRVLPKGNRDQ